MTKGNNLCFKQSLWWRGSTQTVKPSQGRKTRLYIHTHTQAHTQCFPRVIKSSHARPTGSPWRIQRPTPTVPAGHRGGCFPWTCFMRPHVFSLGIGSFGKKKAQQCRSGFWTSEQLLITDSSQSCTPYTPNSPGLWLKRLPVGGLASTICWRSSQVFSCLRCLCFIKNLTTAMFTGHSEFWMRGFLEFINLLLLVCALWGEDTPVY